MTAIPDRMRWPRTLSAWPLPARYGMALFLVVVTTAIIVLFNSTNWGVMRYANIENPGTVFIITVTLAAVFWGFGPALLATVGSLVAVFLFFAKYENLERAVVMIGTMLIIAALAEWQRGAQRRAERAQAKFEAIVESMSDAVMVVDAAGSATDVNHAAIAMLGVPGRAAALRYVTHAREDGTPRTDEYRLLLRALAGENAPQQDVTIVDAGDARVVSAIATAMRDTRGQIIGAVSVSRDITDRVRAERERELLLTLVEERRRFAQAIFDTVPVSLAVVNTDTMIFSAANPAFLDAIPEPYRMHGVNDRAVTAVLPHTAENGFAEQLRRVGATGTPFVTPATAYEHPRRGMTYWNEMMVPLVMTDPSAHHVLYIAADVTEPIEGQQRIAALAKEAAAHASQLEAVFSALTEGLILTDREGTIIRSNEAVGRILGLDGQPVPPLNTFGERFVMRDARDARTPQTERVALAALEGATATNQLRRFRNARGEECWMSVSASPVRDESGMIAGAAITMRDVTEERRGIEERERLLHEVDERRRDAAQRASELETVITSITDGVMFADPGGRIILENEAARRLTGRKPENPDDRFVTAERFRDARGTPMRYERLPLARALRGETVVDQVMMVWRPDMGEDRFLIGSSNPVRAGDGTITGAVAVFRDITEMKQLEQLKDEFVSIAAHELRTPLTAIKGYADLLDRRLSAREGRETDRKSLAVIRKQADRLTGLVNEMLDVSRIEAGRLHLNVEPFDLAALVRDVVSSMSVSSETHHFALATEPGLTVSGDTARIEQVVMNLLSNAVTYAPDGGDIQVRVWSEKGAAHVSVHDEGVGIAPEDLPHLFDRFYRSPRVGIMRAGGMGLGLYICREILARHGGTIRAESTIGVGSTFTFTLPLHE